MSTRSPILSIRTRGELACFTRPEFKVERISYPVMPPSAARGLLEAVLWKPAIAWRIERIRVLKPIRFTTFRRNEIKSKSSAPIRIVSQGNSELAPCFFIEEDRAQRNTVALCDVDYVIEASFIMTSRAGPQDNIRKFIEMFERRIAKGQHFHQPYLGCREFAAEILSPAEAPEPIADTCDLGLMLWDIQFGKDRNTSLFFAAQLERGVLEIPKHENHTDRSAPGGVA